MPKCLFEFRGISHRKWYGEDSLRDDRTFPPLKTATRVTAVVPAACVGAGGGEGKWPLGPVLPQRVLGVLCTCWDWREGNSRVECRPHIGKATGILPSHLMSQFPKVIKEAVLLYNPVCKILQNARCCCDV